MSLRKHQFTNKEFYHIYNRGVDKRNIFSDQSDLDRFFQSMKEFNVIQPIGSLRAKLSGLTAENSDLKYTDTEEARLVNFVCYCLNSNHYHFILEQLTDNGVSEFMKRLGGGYTWYFNNKFKRSGSLFQGTYKSIHIESNEYLLHLAAYVNLNNLVHSKLSGLTAEMYRSSWEEYMGKAEENFCNKDIILNQFSSVKEYKNFAKESLASILEKRSFLEEADKSLLE